MLDQLQDIFVHLLLLRHPVLFLFLHIHILIGVVLLPKVQPMPFFLVLLLPRVDDLLHQAVEGVAHAKVCGLGEAFLCL